jgi:hypothetical protein
MELTSPALASRCMTLERWASELLSVPAISLLGTIRPDSLARNTIACMAIEAASDIFIIFDIGTSWFN